MSTRVDAVVSPRKIHSKKPTKANKNTLIYNTNGMGSSLPMNFKNGKTWLVPKPRKGLIQALRRSSSSNKDKNPSKYLQPCKFFARGYCSRGESCRYLHDTISKSGFYAFSNTDVCQPVAMESVVDASVYFEKVPSSTTERDIKRMASQFGHVTIIRIFPSKNKNGLKAGVCHMISAEAAWQFIDYIMQEGYSANINYITHINALNTKEIRPQYKLQSMSSTQIFPPLQKKQIKDMSTQPIVESVIGSSAKDDATMVMRDGVLIGEQGWTTQGKSRVRQSRIPLIASPVTSSSLGVTKWDILTDQEESDISKAIKEADEKEDIAAALKAKQIAEEAEGKERINAKKTQTKLLSWADIQDKEDQKEEKKLRNDGMLVISGKVYTWAKPKEDNVLSPSPTDIMCQHMPQNDKKSEKEEEEDEDDDDDDKTSDFDESEFVDDDDFDMQNMIQLVKKGKLFSLHR